jgi:hypothetical protein
MPPSFVTRPHVNFVEQVSTEKGKEEALSITGSSMYLMFIVCLLFGYLAIEN